MPPPGNVDRVRLPWYLGGGIYTAWIDEGTITRAWNRMQITSNPNDGSQSEYRDSGIEYQSRLDGQIRTVQLRGSVDQVPIGGPIVVRWLIRGGRHRAIVAEYGGLQHRSLNPIGPHWLGALITWFVVAMPCSCMLNPWPQSQAQAPKPEGQVIRSSPQPVSETSPAAVAFRRGLQQARIKENPQAGSLFIPLTTSDADCIRLARLGEDSCRATAQKLEGQALKVLDNFRASRRGLDRLISLGEEAARKGDPLPRSLVTAYELTLLGSYRQAGVSVQGFDPYYCDPQRRRPEGLPASHPRTQAVEEVCRLEARMDKVMDGLHDLNRPGGAARSRALEGYPQDVGGWLRLLSLVFLSSAVYFGPLLWLGLRWHWEQKLKALLRMQG